MFRFRAFPFQKEQRPKPLGFPFGHLRFAGTVRLPGAFRRLARPSSALEPSHSPEGIICRTQYHPELYRVRGQSVWVMWHDFTRRHLEEPLSGFRLAPSPTMVIAGCMRSRGSHKKPADPRERIPLRPQEEARTGQLCLSVPPSRHPWDGQTLTGLLFKRSPRIFRRAEFWPQKGDGAGGVKVGKDRGFRPVHRARSSNGRASGLQPEGSGFESPRVHFCRRGAFGPLPRSTGLPSPPKC